MTGLAEVGKTLTRIEHLSEGSESLADLAGRILEFLLEVSAAESACIFGDLEDSLFLRVRRDGASGTSSADCPVELPARNGHEEPDWDGLARTLREQTGEQGLVFPLRNGDQSYGVLALLDMPDESGESESLRRITLPQVILPFVQRVFREHSQHRLRRYHRLEADLLRMAQAGRTPEEIAGALRAGLGLKAVGLLVYNHLLSRLDVLAGSSTMSPEAERVLEETHVTLTPSHELAALLKDSGESILLDPGVTGDLLTQLDRTQWVSAHGGAAFGSLLLAPGGPMHEGSRLLLAAVKEENRDFSPAQREALERVAQGMAPTLRTKLAETEHDLAKALRRVIRDAPRRIMDNADIHEEAAAIRRQLGMHSCFVLLFDRNEQVARLEGLDSELASVEPETGALARLDLNTLYSAGYSRQEMHQLQVFDLADYIRHMPEGTALPTAAGAAALEELAGLRNTTALKVIQLPLLDSFRRLQGVVALLRDPARELQPSDLELLGELSSRLSSAFEIRHNLYADSLTGLPNLQAVRAVTVDKLMAFEPFSLIACKLLNLEEVVLAKGDEVVDESIVAVAARIRRLADHEEYRVLTGRNSGESTLMIIYESDDEAQIDDFCSRLISTVTEAIELDGGAVKLFANVGVCHSADISDTEMVFNYSKLALRAIAEERNSIRVFDAEMQRAYLAEKQLEDEIRTALQRRDFVVHYQPKVLCDGTPVGYEALVRWNRGGELVFPGRFIDTIERIGMSQQLFDIVIEQVCRDMAAASRLFDVSINISPSQFAVGDLPARIAATVAAHGIDPASLTLEIVETTMLDSAFYHEIDALKGSGFRLSLDDFGTGYARYKTLLDLFNQGVIDEVKIDGIFARDLSSSANRSFVESVRRLAREFGVRVVIEGVETAGYLREIASIDPAIVVQGWVVSRAQPLERLEQLDERGVVARRLAGGETE